MTGLPLDGWAGGAILRHQPICWLRYAHKSSRGIASVFGRLVAQLPFTMIALRLISYGKFPDLRDDPTL